MLRFKSLILFVFLAFLAAGAAWGQSASALFAEGNDLVRSGVYRTALLRYREAAAAGLDSPLLHYNLGVAYYKLGEFDDAAAEFARAATASELASLATYNRGLAQRAGGDSTGAAQSFATVAETADERDLRRLAEGATTIGPGSATTAPRAQVARNSDESRGIGEFRLAAAARFGQDDNVYRTPAEPYVDLSDPAQPVVTPVVQSGTYVPAELHAAYVMENEAGDTDFRFAYDVVGAFYGEEVSNATEVDQRFSLGADILLGERDARRREVSTAFFVRSHDETNFDPDDGLAREITTVVDNVVEIEDVSERFAYAASGVEGTFGHRLGPWRWGFDMHFERREYEPTVAVENYDHDYFFTAVDIDYDFSSVMTLRGGIRRYQRLYDTRPARDLNGALLTTNPAQEYVYSGVQLGLSRQMGRIVAIDADYLRLDRSDEYLGYYDYIQDVLRIRATFRPNSRFDWSVAAVGRTYDYPNAFAFNVAAGGPRELDEVGAEIHGNFYLKYGLTLSASLDTFDATSTDARAAYMRTRASLGIEWRR